MSSHYEDHCSHIAGLNNAFPGEIGDNHTAWIMAQLIHLGDSLAKLRDEVKEQGELTRINARMLGR